MNRRAVRVFVDTNMLIFAAQYLKTNVFEWIDELYDNVWIHVDVLDELLVARQVVESEIQRRAWHVFDPVTLTTDERVIYQAQVNQIKAAFRRMNQRRAEQGKRVKYTTDTGEIAILAVCLLEDAQLICSNDADIGTVVEQEQYTYVDATTGLEQLIVQDSLADFCYYCVVEAGIAKSKVRHFYKSLFDNKYERQQKLTEFDQRLAAILTDRHN